jgi:hypothetical protein
MLAGNRGGISSKGPSLLESRLKREITGEVFFDSFNRGRYATDASFYQIMPAGVVVPRNIDKALRALAIARDDGRIVTPRGGGTSQCGQTINDGIVVDFSKHLNRIIVIECFQQDSSPLRNLRVLGMCLLCCVSVSILSWNFIEIPARDWLRSVLTICPACLQRSSIPPTRL